MLRLANDTRRFLNAYNGISTLPRFSNANSLVQTEIIIYGSEFSISYAMFIN